MKYEIVFTSRFKRDLKRAKKQGRDIDKLFEVAEMLANDEVLDDSYYDHPLEGKYSKYRECHITSDWLLIYQKTESNSHAFNGACRHTL